MATLDDALKILQDSGENLESVKSLIQESLSSVYKVDYINGYEVKADWVLPTLEGYVPVVQFDGCLKKSLYWWSYTWGPYPSDGFSAALQTQKGLSLPTIDDPFSEYSPDENYEACEKAYKTLGFVVV